DDDDAVFPAIVDAGLADVQVVARHARRFLEPSRRAGDGRVAPGQTEIRELDVGPELRQFDRLRPRDVRQLAAAQAEAPIRVFSEDALPRAPRPLLVAGQAGNRLGPVRDDVVRAEDVLAAGLARHGGKPDILPRLALHTREPAG